MVSLIAKDVIQRSWPTGRGFLDLQTLNFLKKMQDGALCVCETRDICDSLVADQGIGCDVGDDEGQVVGDIMSVGDSSVGETILQRGEDMVEKTTIVVKVDNNQARVTKNGKRKRKEKKKR